MTDISFMISTPSEYIPYLVATAFVVSFIPVLFRVLVFIDPDSLLKSTVKGMNAIGRGFGSIIIAVIGAVVLPGLVTDLGGIECGFMLAVEIACIWSIFVGVCNIRTVADALRILNDIADDEDREKITRWLKRK